MERLLAQPVTVLQTETPLNSSREGVVSSLDVDGRGSRTSEVSGVPGIQKGKTSPKKNEWLGLCVLRAGLRGHLLQGIFVLYSLPRVECMQRHALSMTNTTKYVYRISHFYILYSALISII